MNYEPVKGKSIAGRIRAVQKQIVAACQRVGRDPAGVTLIAVSKTFTWEENLPAYEAGLRDFGENYIQDMISKISRTSSYEDIRWHFIGHLQRNKVRYWNPGFYLFHCLDSLRLAKEIEKKAEREQMVIPVLLQVKLGDESTKSGVDPAALPAFLEKIANFHRLKIEGLMTIPPYVVDPEESRCYYKQLRELRDDSIARGLVDPKVFCHLSMGMSHDYPVAVEEGATYVRVGSAIFGPRRQRT
ncbi:MAG: YggS family pyridoxal phosphate-dependent enzyme [Pseudomonadota bacterium]|nr:YggS family pyridoxal phosphate-dependent enzyme [Pseudomonadota bacterium]